MADYIEHVSLGDRRIRRFRSRQENRMSISRRNVMAFLGLGAAGGPALATDAMLSSEPGVPQIASANYEKGKLIAGALRRLADGIENGGVDTTKLTINSEISPDAIIVQNLTVSFVLTA